MAAIDMIGEKVNMLTVLRRAPNNKEGDAMWVCRCDCGNIKEGQSYTFR